MEVIDQTELMRQKDIQIHNRAVVAKSSWMCRMFQENELDSKEKKEILKSLFMDHKKKDKRNA